MLASKKWTGNNENTDMCPTIDQLRSIAIMKIEDKQSCKERKSNQLKQKD